MSWTRRTFLKNTVVMGAAAATAAAFLDPSESGASCIRPPGALPEDEFLSTCLRCGRCADACPNRCITTFTKETGSPFSMTPGRGEQGTPVIFPRQQACNLCAARKGAEHLLCTAACPSGALRLVRKDMDEIRAKVRMGRAQIDTNLCYSYNNMSCGVCVRACPFDRVALRAGLHEKPILDPSACVGCGLCERVCIRYPQAITVAPNPERSS
ncbi:MAG: 4Fe-4S dicluster domain-containing protein [Planctomycetota bacterium]